MESAVSAGGTRFPAQLQRAAIVDSSDDAIIGENLEGLGAEVVAEGIEAADDLEMLKTLGVQYGQGFLLGRPG